MDKRVNRTPSAIPDLALKLLQQLLGDRLDLGAGVRERHGQDESWHPAMAPDAVAFAISTDEVSEIVKICAAHKVPVIPYGVGTSLEGHVGALKGGLCIDLGQMNQIVEV
ncbi:MAG: FAD-binding protein, partial [Rhodospirillaceae bacterium]|nr:FAD-binding protein [Rhodospirillaceae bacterium]